MRELSRGTDVAGTQSYPWDELRNGEVRVCVFELPPFPLGQPGGRDDDGTQTENVKEGGAAVSDDVDAHLALVLDMPCAQDPRVLRLVLMILQQPVGGRVRLPKIARSGGAQPGGAGVNIHLTAAHAILQRLAAIYPGALGRVATQIGVYAVAVLPLLWELCSKLERAIQHRERGVGMGGGAAAAAAAILTGWPAAPEETALRPPLPNQQRVLTAMQARVREGKAASFVYMTVGTGKTYLTALHMRFLQAEGLLPDYVIVTTPATVVDTVAAEYAMAGFTVHHFAASQSVLGRAGRQYVIAPRPFAITIVEHDQLRLLVDPLAEIAARSLLVVDEVHLMFNTNTLRTSAAQTLAGAAARLILMTGTPIVNGNPATMSPWLSRVVSFEITPKNFWVAAGAMYKSIEQTDNAVEQRVVELSETILPAAYRARVSAHFGGINQHATQADFAEAIRLCREVCDTEIVQRVVDYLRLPPVGDAIPRGAVVVAQTAAHQEILSRLLVAAVRGLAAPGGGEAVHTLTRGGLNLTPERVRAGLVPPYRVVVMTTRQAHGINLTYLNAMFMSVYPSNQATREQLLGRINRSGQPVGKGAAMGALLYVTVTVGVLNYILANHEKAKTLSAALQLMALQ